MLANASLIASITVVPFWDEVSVGLVVPVSVSVAVAVALASGY